MTLATLTPVANAYQLTSPGVMVPPLSSSVTAASVSTGMQTLLNFDYFLSASMFTTTGSFIVNNENTTINSTQVEINATTFVVNGETQLFGTTVQEPNTTLAITAGAQILFVSGASSQVDSGANLLMLNGSTMNVSGQINLQGPNGQLAVFAGAGILIETGAGMGVRTGANIDVNSGGEIIFAGGSTLDVASGAMFEFPGATSTITDSTNPSYATPQSITKTQPMVITTNSPLTSLAGNQLTDAVGGGNIYDCMCTTYINGCTISSMIITILTTFTAPTSADATAVLYRCDNTNTPVTLTALASKTIPIGLPNLTYQRYTVNLGTPEVTNEADFTYFIRFTASSTEALTWLSPKLGLTNITQLGQF